MWWEGEKDFGFFELLMLFLYVYPLERKQTIWRLFTHCSSYYMSILSCLQEFSVLSSDWIK